MATKSKQTGPATVASGPEGFIDKVEARRRLNCGARTLDTWMKRRIVPFYKISKRVAFKWSEIETAMERKYRVDRDMGTDPATNGTTEVRLPKIKQPRFGLPIKNEQQRKR